MNETRERTSSQRISGEVCLQQGHSLVLLWCQPPRAPFIEGAWQGPIHVDKKEVPPEIGIFDFTLIICTKCGMTIEEIRGEKKA